MGQWVLSPDGVGGYGTSAGSAYYWSDPYGDPNNPSSAVGLPPDIAANQSDPNAQNLGGWSQQAIDYYKSQGQDVAGSGQGFIQHGDPNGGSMISQVQSTDDGSGLGGVAGWIRGHGYAVPLAFMAAAGGAAALGAGAAEGAGAGAAAEGAGGLAGGGAFTPAAGSGASFGIDAGATYGSAGLGSVPFELPDGTMGSIQNGNILDASGNVVAQGGTGTSLSDLASYANKARQGYGVLNSLSKLLGGSGSTLTGGSNGSVNPQQLANILSPKATTNDFIGQYKMNQNPFTFSGQTQISPNQYDVSGSSIANALRKPNGTNT